MWLRGSWCLVRQVKLLGGSLQLEVWANLKTCKNHNGREDWDGLPAQGQDIVLRRTCTMPLIGQENPKLDIDCGCV